MYYSIFDHIYPTFHAQCLLKPTCHVVGYHTGRMLFVVCVGVGVCGGGGYN